MKKNLAITILLTAILFLPQTAYPAELLTNGSFETGDFTGWTTMMTQTNAWCSSWVVATSSNSCLASVTPQDGSRVAMNGFDGTGGEFILYQDVAIPANMSARLTFMYRARWNISNAANLPRTFNVQIRDPATNNVLETVYTFTANSGSPNQQDSDWITQQMFISQYAGQTIRLYFIENIPQTYTGPGQFELDGVKLESFPPTAANVTVQGRVFNFRGRGISRAFVSISDGSGEVRSALTNPFGYYRFEDVEVGNTYILEVHSKRYLFTNSPYIVQISEELSNINFRASP